MSSHYDIGHRRVGGRQQCWPDVADDIGNADNVENEREFVNCAGAGTDDFVAD